CCRDYQVYRGFPFRSLYSSHERCRHGFSSSGSSRPAAERQCLKSVRKQMLILLEWLIYKGSSDTPASQAVGREFKFPFLLHTQSLAAQGGGIAAYRSSSRAQAATGDPSPPRMRRGRTA